MKSESKKPNRLIHESSPYLLEHSYNPVDWWPWGQEAFDQASKLNRPVFLSIGYSSCHWCHIMRKESFEDERTANLMNELFINIKLDREERPDIDHQYQLIYQLVNNRGGGWPLSMWLTPDKQPIFAGTYFPVQPRYGMPGFTNLCRSIAGAFNERTAEVIQQAAQLTSHTARIGTGQKSGLDIPSPGLVKKDIADLMHSFDPQHGGFGGAPKFPHETSLSLLINEAGRLKNKDGLTAIQKTLDEMIAGGIYDHLGGGFHRYTVDNEWLIPHFEKMLYNQAQMVLVLLEASRLIGKKQYQLIAEETLEYVIREMTDKAGGFFSAQNADSGEEGKEEEGEFFVWSKKELYKILGDDNAQIFAMYYDVSKKGNWEGKNILRIVSTFAEVAKKFEITEIKAKETITEAKKKLFETRTARIPPSTDTKVLTSWTSLMIQSFILASRFRANTELENRYWDIAEKALNFLMNVMVKDNQLYRVYTEGRVKIPGFLDGYQYFIAALLDAFEVNLETRYLKFAEKLFDQCVNNFWDLSNGGFFFSNENHETPVSRFKDIFDAAIPSPNAVAIENAIRLDFFLENKNDKKYYDMAHNTLKMFSQIATKGNAMGMAKYYNALSLWLNHFTELTLWIGKKSEPEKLLQQINSIWVPFRLQIELSPGEIPVELQNKSWIQGKDVKKSNFTAYICRNFVCSLPMTNMTEVEKYIENMV